jgi:homogentisate 1,2-dioxygenase
MLDYVAMGKLPRKHHIVFRQEDGTLYQEHCFTRKGFDDVYSILYHVHPPTRESEVVPSTRFAPEPRALDDDEHLHNLKRRHYHTRQAAQVAGESILHARTLLLTNQDCGISVARPKAGGDYFFANNDGDDLYFVYEGSGWLETTFGKLPFRQDDYIFVPRSCMIRFHFDTKDNYLLIIEAKHGLRIPDNFRQPGGQLKLDAPYSHRDFHRPTELSWTPGTPLPEGPFTIVTKKMGRFSEHTMPHYPFDIVGWDGYLYPLTFNINDYQAKAGLVHLPPPIHTTFVARGFVVCSFVPRMVDFHPEAIPCPYAHSSVDCDEVLFYVRGNFTSRRGVEPTSITLHPSGLPHGPHPGAYEKSVGTRDTHELAVMIDTFAPLRPTTAAAGVEDTKYHKTWILE